MDFLKVGEVVYYVFANADCYTPDPKHRSHVHM